MASTCGNKSLTGGKMSRRRHSRSHKRHAKSHKKHAKSHKKHAKSHKKRHTRRKSQKGGNMLMDAIVPFGLWGAKNVMSQRLRKKHKSHKK